LASLLHLPTVVLLWWVRTVGERCAALPLGRFGPVHVLGLGAVAGLAVVARRGPPAVRRPTAWLAVLIGLVVVGSAARLAPAPPAGTHLALGPGAQLWVGAGATVVVVDGRAQLGALLGGLRTAGVRSVDLVVCRTASRSAAGAVTGL